MATTFSGVRMHVSNRFFFRLGKMLKITELPLHF